MPYANNNGVKIYYEVEGEGPPLVLAHGATSSLDLWRMRGYPDALKHDYRLVLLDFRGHGRSDRPHDASAYGQDMTVKMAADVVAVLDDLGIENAHYYGYSMGAMIGYRVAIYHADRFRSFILGGMTPYRYPDAMIKLNRETADGYALLVNDPEAAVVRFASAMGVTLTPDVRIALLDRMKANDPQAAIAVLTSMIDLPPLTDKDLAGIPVPCLVYCGELDPSYAGAKECVNHMTQARFVSLPGLHHGTALARSDLILPHIKEFLAGVGKTQLLK